MNIIAVETSTRLGSVALACDGDVLAEKAFVTYQSHGRDLLPMVDALCRDAGLKPTDVGLVAVSIGPGSFTGIRISVAFAKTMAWQTDAKIIAVPSLMALAKNGPTNAVRVATILDAKRGGVYASTFEREGDVLVQTFGPAVIDPEEYAAALPRPAFVIGNGLKKASGFFPDCPQADEDLWTSRAGNVAQLAWEMHKADEHTSPEDLQPLYLRRPEAEVLFEQRKERKRQNDG
ncbi:MAG: tRNA (adenosine(37)-N6)-threonylcarbamoyltransferase complex dimerization subunit type 1 TsaB [Phycisphaerae bacterium]|jgi:tRNA threonylcarbamoyladenosine biosynthesis protein TsaB|nr:tRNA (adenosine(37)-N6)-threonylcarbamoyltransferase complex dimerization subunit type 1 TsaB [Phycisphaerae bacterium]